MSVIDVMEEAQRLLLQFPRYIHVSTSKSGPRGEIVEIAVVDTNDSKLADELVRPRGVIRPAFSQVHGITNEHLRAAPRWAEVWPQVYKLLEGRLVIAFDHHAVLQLLRQSHQISQLPWDVEEARWHSVLALFARLRREIDPSSSRHHFHLPEAAELMGISSETVLYRQALDEARLVRTLLLHIANPTGRS